MDYGDILHHQPYNEVINSKLECIRYNTTFAITGAIKGTSGSKLYKELGLGSWRSWRTTTLRCPCAFHKIVSTHLLSYFFNLIPHSQGSQQSVKSLKSGNCQGIWKIPSFLQKVRELSGNLGLHQRFSIAIWEFSEMNLPCLCLSLRYGNVSKSWMVMVLFLFEFSWEMVVSWIIEAVNPLESPCILWKLELCLKYFLLLEKKVGKYSRLEISVWSSLKMLFSGYATCLRDPFDNFCDLLNQICYLCL